MVNKFSIPTVKSKLPLDLKRFIDRVREAFDSISSESTKIIYESIPGVNVGFFHIESCAATTDYTVGYVLPEPGDRRVRVQITAGSTGATFTLTHGSDTYSFILAARQTDSIILNGQGGIKDPYLVQSNTGSIGFTVQLFIPSSIKLS